MLGILDQFRVSSVLAAGAVGWLLCLAGGAPVAAQGEGGSYEARRLGRALRARGLSEAGGAEGRTIVRVHVIREEVFAQDEFLFGGGSGPAGTSGGGFQALTFLNHLHGLTAEKVILRELPFEVGEAYRAAAAEEGMRNLRGLGIFALVRIVPVESPGGGGVDVVVYTRDLWSLRLESDFQGQGANLQLLGQLTERNMFGLGKTGSLRFELRPDTVSAGEVYYDYRLLGGRQELRESFDVVVNRATGEAEGFFAFAGVGRPFYKLAQRWSYEVSASVQREVSRTLDDQGRARGADLSDEPSTDGSSCDLAREDCVPQVYARGSGVVSAAVHRRFGHVVRQTWTGGFAFSDRSARAIAETRLPAAQRARFESRVLPRARRLSYPYLRYRLDTPRFGVFSDLGAFGISENVQLGPWTDTTLGVPLAALGSARDGLLAGTSVGYRAQLGRGLLDVYGAAGARLEGGRVLDQRLTGQLRAATPPWLLGRLVLLGRFEGRQRDSARSVVLLDGANGLRGHPIGAFVERGGSRMFGSMEYRTLPLRWDAVHVGLVGFYDAGSVHRRVADITLHHGAGAGLRLLLPQLNRFVLRVDAGVALDVPGYAVLASYGVGQAVPLTPIEDQALQAGIRGQ